MALEGTLADHALSHTPMTPADWETIRATLPVNHPLRIGRFVADGTPAVVRLLHEADFGWIARKGAVSYGDVDSLPAAHWARTLLPPDLLLVFQGRRCLALGNAGLESYDPGPVVERTRRLASALAPTATPD